MQKYFYYNCDKEKLISTLEENLTVPKRKSSELIVFIKKENGSYSIMVMGTRGGPKYGIEIGQGTIELNNNWFYWFITVIFWIVSIGFILYSWSVAVLFKGSIILVFGPLIELLLPIAYTLVGKKNEKLAEEKMSEIIEIAEGKN